MLFKNDNETNLGINNLQAKKFKQKNKWINNWRDMRQTNILYAMKQV